MKKLKRFLVFANFLLSLSHGAIWETEDSFIIDDLPEDETETTTITTELEDSCTTSSGEYGQCIPKNDCNPFLTYFSETHEVLEGMRRYLEDSDLESCEPTTLQQSSREDMSNSSSTEFVCCTSLKYNSKVKRISLEDYLKLDPPGTVNESTSIPEIPFSSPEEISPVQEFILDGHAASVGEFPFAVAIISNGRQICGGSLLGSLWVASASHCFDRFTPSAVRRLSVKVGDYDLSTYSESAHQDIPVQVQKLFLHPGFFRQQGFFRDDVALLKLRRPVSPANHIRAIQLHSGSPNIDGSFVQATVCGWGKTCGSCSQSSVLRKVKVTLVSTSECQRKYSGTAAPPITQNMICAGGYGGDACNGDSGGPLIIYSGRQAYQIGIVSWGIGCGQYPGVYTRVSNFREWVHRYMQRG